MLVGERRTAKRKPRLATARFTWSGRPRTAVMTDLSVVGAFLNTNVFPPVGATLSLTYDVGALAPLTLRGHVVHVIDPAAGASGLQGFGVRWLDAAGGGGDLQVLVRRFLEADVSCRPEPDGRISWAQAALPMPAPEPAAVPAAEPEQRADGPADRRRSVRLGCEVPVKVALRRGTCEGLARNVSLRGLWIDLVGELPGAGDILTVRFPLPVPGGFARITCRVVRLGDRGFGVQVLRIDERGATGAFAAHLETLGR